jgi:hypothetical protein
MARSRDEFLGCPKCRTTLFRLRAVRGDNVGGAFFSYDRQPLTEQTDARNCATCGEPLMRMHKETWE